MLTDRRLAEIEDIDKKEWIPFVEELIDEIKRLRSELEILKARDSDAEAIIGHLRAELSRYTTPQVENVTFKEVE